jgi:transcriptional regulator with XRE-family HTH domain
MRAGLNQRELGEFVGLTRASVSNLEGGHQGAALATWARIAEVLDVSLDALVAELGRGQPAEQWARRFAPVSDNAGHRRTTSDSPGRGRP